MEKEGERDNILFHEIRAGFSLVNVSRPFLNRENRIKGLRFEDEERLQHGNRGG